MGDDTSKMTKIEVNKVRQFIKEHTIKMAANVTSILEEVSILYLAILYSEDTNKDKDMLNYQFVDEEIDEFIMRRIIEKHTKSIVLLSGMYEVQTLKNVVMSINDSHYPREKELSTPQSICKLASAILDIQDDDVVLDLGSGMNGFLSRLNDSSINATLVGVEQDDDIIMIHKIRQLVSNKEINLIKGDLLSDDFNSLGGNKVFADLPFGHTLKDFSYQLENNPKLNDYFELSTKGSSGDWVYTMAAYLSMKKGGKTLVIMTNGGTWNSSDIPIRKQLIELGLVEAIISLPEKLFSRTTMPASLVLLSENNQAVKMVDAKELYLEGRRQNTMANEHVEIITKALLEDSDISVKVANSILMKNDYIINPQRYVGQIDVVNGQSIKNIVKSIRRGAMISGRELDSMMCIEPTNYNYLKSRDIIDNEIGMKLPYLKAVDDKLLKQQIKYGDIVITKNWPLKVAMATSHEDVVTIANGNLYIITVDKEIMNPTYFYIFLQSELAMSQFERLVKGAAIPNITKKDLESILVPMVDIDSQNVIVNEFIQVNDEKNLLKAQLEAVDDRKTDLINDWF